MMSDLQSLPKLQSLPEDPVDSSFALSFDVCSNESLRESVEFFNTYGYVVYRDIFDSRQCAETRRAMWEILEESNPGFDHSDITTWSKLKAKGNYGLSIRGASFHPTLVDNRQNPNLITAISALLANSEQQQQQQDQQDVDLGTDILTDVMVSQDRFTVYRATKLDKLNNDSDVSIDTTSFGTGERNLHLDLNPWWWIESSELVKEGIETLNYQNNTTKKKSSKGDANSNNTINNSNSSNNNSIDQSSSALEPSADFIKENNLVIRSMGRHVQCVLNFQTNRNEDGGTLIVPFFHRYLSHFCTEYAQYRKNLPWLQFPNELEQHLLQYAHRVPMREGSVLIWDQTVAHGTAPNASSNCRMAQYLMAFRRSTTFSKSKYSKSLMTQSNDGDSGDGESSALSDRLYRRSVAVRECLHTSGALSQVSELGKTLFGLDIIS